MSIPTARVDFVNYGITPFYLKVNGGNSVIYMIEHDERGRDGGIMRENGRLPRVNFPKAP